MKNWRFHQQLRQCVDGRGRRMTVSLLARALGINRGRLCDTLNNKLGHGGQTRPKIAAYLRRKWPERAAEVLATLGWDTAGNIQPPKELRVETNVPPVTMFPVEPDRGRQPE